jgi:4-hydroxy-tetrahydrodipicolinate reductase
VLIALCGRTEGIRLKGLLDTRAVGRETVEDLVVFDHISREGGRGAVVVDFSSPDAVRGLVGALSGSGAGLVSGTTGLGERERSLLEKYSEEAAVLYDTNMSYGISVMKRLLRETSTLLAKESDVEIVECHHRWKRDQPSGTTYSLARAIDPDAVVVSGRAGDAGAPGRAIRAHSVRLGGVRGEHRVYFGTEDEILCLSHSVLSREAFARGALRAVRFIAGKDRGMFSMEDLASI